MFYQDVKALLENKYGWYRDRLSFCIKLIDTVESENWIHCVSKGIKLGND
jgi:hypothetical protein